MTKPETMPDSRYRIPSFENTINKVINFIFYYRLVVVIIAVIGISILARIIYLNSQDRDKTQNVALILTGGSIIIAIFYSIINYEHTQTKFKYDVKTSRETLSYHTYCKMYEKEMMTHFRNLRKFYEANQDLFIQNRHNEVEKLLKEEPDTNIGFISIFNYFESLCIGVNFGLMDEAFVKEFFKTIFRDYLDRYGTYLDYMRKERNSQRIFRNFISVAQKWNNSD